MSKPAWHEFQYRRQNYFIEAAGNGNIRAMKFCRFLGADVNEHCCGRYNAIIAAVSNSNRESIEFLLQNGGSVNASAKFGLTALHRAVSNGDLPIVQLLVSKGANVNSIDELSQTTPLMRAYEIRRIDIAQFLLLHGAKTIKEISHRRLDIENSLNDITQTQNYGLKSAARNAG